MIFENILFVFLGSLKEKALCLSLNKNNRVILLLSKWVTLNLSNLQSSTNRQLQTANEPAFLVRWAGWQITPMLQTMK